MSNILSKSRLGGLAAGAALALAPVSAQAVTLKIEDIGAGVDVSVTDSVTASYSGPVGAFTVNVASATISSEVNQHRLNTTSIETAGIGNLRITATEENLTDFGASTLNLFGTGSISDIGNSVTVQHFIDTGSGWTQVGSDIEFLKSGGDFQSGSASQTFAAGVDGFVSLRSIFDIENTKDNMTSNVNSTLVAAVPLPAGGLLLLTALGGMAVVRRRRKAA